ncbi:MAG: hypothetical protein JW790_03390 [Dehalococcoidales bacterium]|nr:hypothetical protein [Dehalococcoidales bacterium]
MPFQATFTLPAYIMGDALREAVGWAPSLLGLVKFGGMKLKYSHLIQLCLDGYIKGTAMGYTFRDKYDLLLSTIVKPGKISDHVVHLRNLVQRRIESYDKEVISLIDFVITTELAKDKLDFDGFLEQAKKSVKIDSAAPRIKLIFEEATALGAYYPDMVTKLVSEEGKESSLDWEKARLMELKFDTKSQDIDLVFLKRWAKHNLGMYCREYFPELVAPMEL